ncbi:hypothetical protein AB0B26_40000, partial [Streptomyces sparsogenes]
MTDRVELIWPTALDDALRASTHRMVHAVTETGGAIGYLAPPDRAETDAWLAGVLADIRTGDAALAPPTSLVCGEYGTATRRGGGGWLSHYHRKATS